MVGLKTVREKLLIPFVEGLNVLVASGKKSRTKRKKEKKQDQSKADKDACPGASGFVICEAFTVS